MLLVAGVMVAAPGFAQSHAPFDTATTNTIRRLLELVHAATVMQQGIEAMIPAQRAASPQIPAAFWDVFLAHTRRNLPRLVDALVPIYASRFSKAELDELVRFYASPVGRHLAEAQPAMMQESMVLGQAWGAEIGREIADSLQHKGDGAVPQ
jgi:hypothetical protein